MKTQTIDETVRSGLLPEVQPQPPAWQVATAFAAIYIVWGSTYLAIRFAVDSIPPFFMAGTRFLTAGSFLYAVVRWRGARRPTRAEWRDAAIAGVLLLACGNGGVTWVEQVFPSGVTALVVALVPLWMVLLDWLRPGGKRPRPLVFAGLAVGFAGVGLLARGDVQGAGSGYGWRMAVLLMATIGWAVGSIFYRHARKPGSAMLGIAMQMLAGGGAMLLFSGLKGEFGNFSFHRMTAASFSGWLYLTTVGSLVGFTAYAWLLRVSTPARVSTYAYVNPFIAVLLGCTIGHEPFSDALSLAGGLIIVAVALIVRSSRAPSTLRGTPVVVAAPPRVVTR